LREVFLEENVLEPAEEPLQRVLLVTENDDEEGALLLAAFGLEGLMEGSALRQAIA
jgi:hypothetical protein